MVHEVNFIVKKMERTRQMYCWSPRGVVEALVVDDRAVARARSVQMVFQDAAGSLNPRITVRPAMNEVCAIRRRMGAECRRSPEELMDLVGLSKSVLDQYPREMSGGGSVSG